MVDSTNLPDVDINQIATDLNGKMDRDGVNATASVCVESWHEGTEWYRVYSDGWCEQGGKIVCAGDSGALQTINLFKEYVDTNYNIQTSYTDTTGIGTYFAIMITNITTSSFKASSWAYGTWYDGYYSWRTCGYIR